MNGAAGISAVRGRGEGSDAKLKAAAEQFEAMMLASLLRPLEQTIASVPGNDGNQPGSQDYASMGTEALATALASGRGFGIARLLLDRLHQSTEASVTSEGSGLPKVQASPSR